MDKFKNYLMRHPLVERERIAAECLTTWPFLRNVAYGYRVAGEKLCVRIEQVTMGAVTRKDLRPDDWHQIWPELKEASHA